MQKAQGCYLALWDEIARWDALACGESLCSRPSAACLTQAAPPHCTLPQLMPAGVLSYAPCSSLPAVLEDVHTLCGAACQRPQLRAPAVSALKLLLALPALPAVKGGSAPKPVSAIVASKPFAELSHFLLRQGPALLRKAVSVAVATQLCSRDGAADALSWAGDLGNGLVIGAPLLLCRPAVELLPAKQLQRGVASWLDAAAEAWEAGAPGNGGCSCAATRGVLSVLQACIVLDWCDVTLLAGHACGCGSGGYMFLIVCCL